MEKKIESYENNISLLENQVNYHKSSKYEVSRFIDYAFMVQNELNSI
jgi:hypothetical protein